MSNTPSKAEIEVLVKRHGATSYRNRADTQHPAYGFTEDGLNGLIDEVLAKWGTPQPAPVPLSDAVEHYLAAQDALDNREYAGINAESYEKLIRRRNASRKDLDAALAAQGGKA